MSVVIAVKMQVSPQVHPVADVAAQGYAAPALQSLLTPVTKTFLRVRAGYEELESGRSRFLVGPYIGL